MFEILSEKLTQVFRLLGAKGRLTEKEIDEGLRQVRWRYLRPMSISGWSRISSPG